MEITWAGETQLMGYGESDSSGAWIKFQVMPEDLDMFRGLKGEVFDVVISPAGKEVVTSGKEVPEAKPKTTHMAEWLGARSDEKQFAMFLRSAYGLPSRDLFDVAEATRKALSVKSRAEVDRDPAAAERCKKLMHEYTAWIG